MNRKRVLVTGSSRGIGRAIARKLAADGWSVAVHFTSHEDEAHELAKEIGASGVYQADLSDPANASVLFGQVWGDGELSAVVNNAGVYSQTPFLSDDETFLGEYRRTMAINLESP